VIVEAPDAESLGFLEDTLRKTMLSASGAALDAALVDLGWLDMLDEIPALAIPLVCKLLGETGAHAPVINDVVLRAAGRDAGATVPLPYAGDSWIVWGRADTADGALDSELPIHRVDGGLDVPLAAGRRAIGWWLTGTSRAMLALARQHALDRVQFGRPVASFQAIRHKLAETLVAIEGAEATLAAAPSADQVDFASLLAKAAAGQAALTAAKHCQQVLAGIGFTAEHPFHRFLARALVLDSVLGSATELPKVIGAQLISSGKIPRLVDL
jgi:Acyl-CoA dehydrogenase, C-terminal domain